MFSKILITTLLGSSLIGGGAATGFVPTSAILAAGPIRVESGGDKMITAYFAAHSPLKLTINLKDEKRLQIKF